ncbi:MAG: hypothetical protein PVH31_08470 [Ectothiorhodospiraceae bacterium]|jgi:hypothetical protein
MNAQSDQLHSLIEDMSQRLPELALPPATDWDMYGVLREASREDCSNARSCRSAWAALYCVRNSLTLAENAELAKDFLGAIDRQLPELRASAGQA